MFKLGLGALIKILCYFLDFLIHISFISAIWLWNQTKTCKNKLKNQITWKLKGKNSNYPNQQNCLGIKNKTKL